MVGLSIANTGAAAAPAPAPQQQQQAPTPSAPPRKGWLGATFRGCVMGAAAGLGIYLADPGTAPVYFQHLTLLNISLFTAGAATAWITGRKLRGHHWTSRAMSMTLALVCMHAAYSFMHDRAVPPVSEPVQKADTLSPAAPQAPKEQTKPEASKPEPKQEQQAPAPAPNVGEEKPEEVKLQPPADETAKIQLEESKITPNPIQELEKPPQRFEPIDDFKGPQGQNEQKHEPVPVPVPEPEQKSAPAPAPAAREQRIREAVQTLEYNRLTPKLQSVYKRAERCELPGKRNARVCNQALKDLSFAAEYGRWGVSTNIEASHNLLTLAYEKSAAEGHKNRQILHDMGDHALRGIGREINKAEGCDYLRQAHSRISRNMMKYACR